MTSFGMVLRSYLENGYLCSGLNMYRTNLFYKLKIGHGVLDVDVIGFECKICMFFTSITCNYLASVRNFRALYSMIIRFFIFLIIVIRNFYFYFFFPIVINFEVR
jgi:hypothetical protein